MIADYEGTVLIVSHDRDFLDRTVAVTLGLDGSGTVDVVAGGYADWAARRAAPASRGDSGGTARSGAGAAAPVRRAPKMSYKDQRDYERLPAHVEALGERIAADEAAMADPDLYTRAPAEFARLTDAVAAARAEREAAEERWLDLAAAAEALAE